MLTSGSSAHCNNTTQKRQGKIISVRFRKLRDGSGTVGSVLHIYNKDFMSTIRSVSCRFWRAQSTWRLEQTVNNGVVSPYPSRSIIIIQCSRQRASGSWAHHRHTPYSVERTLWKWRSWRKLFVCLFGFLTSSSTTRLYRGRAPRQSVWQFYVLPHMRQSWETISVSAGHIILTPTQPV